jgi:chaperonin GroES
MLKLEKKLNISELHTNVNIARMLPDEDLEAIGAWVKLGYDQDERSRSTWLQQNDVALRLAMQITSTKSFPWPNASNVAFPLLTVAALQFHARSYPTLFQGSDLVKYRVPGVDPTGALADVGRRVARFMSHQVLDLDEAFEEQHDRLLLNVPIVGCAFVKSFFDHTLGTPISEFVSAKDLVIDYYAKSVDAALRKTQIIPLYRNEVYERVATGRFLDILDEPWYTGLQPAPRRATDLNDDRISGTRPPSESAEAECVLFLEQHTYIDFDQDGYAEPYIITVEKTTGKVVRIIARWDMAEDVQRIGSTRKVGKIVAAEYYTKYELLPAPDGSIYGMGFGRLVGPLNEATNTLVNQLIDAGTAATTSGGFLAKGVKIRGGAMQLEPWAWKTVETGVDDLRKGIVPAPIREPSAVLFNLLSLLINYTQRIGGATDTMVGENPGQNTPATNMKIMVEQGTKIYSGIFKRLWRSMRGEFRKRFILNGKYLDDAVEFGEGEVRRSEFLGDPSRLIPAADPNLSSEAVRLQQAIALREAAATNPAYKRDAVEKNFLRALGVDSPDEYYGSVEDIPPAKDPRLAVAELQYQRDMARLELDTQDLIATLEQTRRLNDAKVLELEAKVAAILDGIEGNAEAREVELFRAGIEEMKATNEILLRQQEVLTQRMEARRGSQPRAT